MKSYDNTFNKNKIKENVRKYEEALLQHRHIYFDSEDFTDIAEYYYNNGNIGKAVEVTDYAISIFSGASAPLLFKARMALIDDRDTLKAKQYASLVTDKTDYEYYYIQAEIMIIDKHTEEANKFLLDKLSDMDEVNRCDFVIDVATIFADYDIIEKAEQWLNMSDDDSLIDYKELKGRIALGKGEYTKSEKIFSSLLDENPYSPSLWNGLASSQWMQDKINDSMTSSEFAIAIDPNDDEATLNKANCLFRLGQYDKAHDFYRRFIRLCPKEDTGYLLLGNTLANLNRPQEAIQQYKIAEKMAKADSKNLLEIYQEQAFMLSYMNQVDEAIKYADKAELAEGSNKSEIMVLHGHILLENNRAEEARDYFRLAVLTSANSLIIYLRIMVSMYDCEYYRAAYNLFKKIEPFLSENWTDGYSYMAASSLRIGKYDEFLHYLHKACALNIKEAGDVLADFFPQNISPDNYYQYAKAHKI